MKLHIFLFQNMGLHKKHRRRRSSSKHGSIHRPSKTNPRTTSQYDFRDERSKKAFDFATDITKQLLTLSTGILTLGATLARGIFIGENLLIRCLIVFSLLLFLISILAGVITLGQIVGELEPDKSASLDQPDRHPSVRSLNLTSCSQIQYGSFFLAVTFVFLIGSISIVFPNPVQPEPTKQKLPLINQPSAAWINKAGPVSDAVSSEISGIGTEPTPRENQKNNSPDTLTRMEKFSD